MSTTVHVVCYKSKILKNNESPLMLRICKDRKVKYKSLGISLNPAFWDFKTGKPVKNCPNREYIEKMIVEKTKGYTDKILELKAMEKEFTVTTLVEKVNKPVKKQTVKEVFITYISQLETSGRLTYMNMYKSTLKSLLDFNGHLDICFSDLDFSWLRRYETWLQSKKLSLNTIGTYFRILRVIYNYAIEENVIKPEYYPFKTFCVSKLSEATAKRSLTKEDIFRVIEYKGNTAYECLAIDLFTFSYLTAGINFVDISRLTLDNVIDNRLVYKRKKTGKLINVPLQLEAMSLINKYKTDGSPYLFPILTLFHKTELQKLNRIHKVIAKVNLCLKSIGKELKIPIDLTTYVARHSFATVLKRSGVNTSIISEALGHSSERVTQIYLDSFGNDQMDEAMKNLF
ncbi:MAG: Tyrosine recombinase XerD [Parabacteroides sp.]